jgi:hypothetical protein
MKCHLLAIKLHKTAVKQCVWPPKIISPLTNVSHYHVKWELTLVHLLLNNSLYLYGTKNVDMVQRGVAFERLNLF